MERARRQERPSRRLQRRALTPAPKAPAPQNPITIPVPESALHDPHLEGTNSHAARVAKLRSLQESHGNAYVQRLMDTRATSGRTNRTSAANTPDTDAAIQRRGAAPRSPSTEVVSLAARGAAPVATLQRNWGSTELEKKDEATEWPQRFQLMNGWSIEYMLETADELKKKNRLNKYIEQSAVPQNVKGIFGDRIIATLKTSAARFDAEYYTCMAAVKPNDPQGFDVLLKRAGKAVSAGRIDASLPQLAVRWFARGESEAAGALLDPLSMTELLNAMVIVTASGYLTSALDPAVHKNALRAKRIHVAAVLADWSMKPGEWMSYEPTLRSHISALDPADSIAIAAWVSNKPELAHLADVGGDMASMGQFAFGQMLDDEIWHLIEAEHADGEDAMNKAAIAAGNRDSKDFPQHVIAGGRLAATSYPALNKIFRPRPVSKKRGLEIYEAIWSEFEKTKTTASMSRFHNYYDLHSLAIAEADRCNAQVRHMHALHTNLGGGASGPAPQLAANGLATGIRQHPVPRSAGPWRGSEVTYVNNLGAVVESMKAVLDSGRRIISGVLSGAQGDMTPEHYLYVIGYRGNSFICADSDPGNEQPGKMPISGITYLYYDPAANRLSTAPTDAAFPINLSASGENRFQMNGPHRYQALMVSVLPSKRAP